MDTSFVDGFLNIIIVVVWSLTDTQAYTEMDINTGNIF